MRRASIRDRALLIRRFSTAFNAPIMVCYVVTGLAMNAYNSGFLYNVTLVIPGLPFRVFTDLMEVVVPVQSCRHMPIASMLLHTWHVLHVCSPSIC